jgi:hypothetical protein
VFKRASSEMFQRAVAGVPGSSIVKYLVEFYPGTGFKLLHQSCAKCLLSCM